MKSGQCSTPEPSRSTRKYAEEWVQGIDDITTLVQRIAAKRRAGQWNDAARLLPVEKPYPLPAHLARSN